MRRRSRGLIATAGIVLASVLTAVAVAYQTAGWYGVNVMARRGVSTWDEVSPTDERLTPGMRLALAGSPTPDVVSSVIWREVRPGLEVAEVPVRVAGRPVDTLLVTRVDPHRYRFRVMSRPAGDRDLDQWMSATGATVVINGSYFARRGAPDTPVVSDGRLLGPATYQATHGAFVVDAAGARLEDLAGRDWRPLLATAEQAMVSYPLLLGADGQGRVGTADPRWLANRSFLGQDRAGRILVVSTTDAYFSLTALSAFLPRSGLDLRLALNLDGGPVSCHAVAAGDYRRRHCGNYETAVHDGRLELLRSLVALRTYPMPVALVVTPA
ncbi:MAG: phosphodiester glycosidase family protein [Kineosporiaceae bacterium]|nr:phosphodiester glycosidase family protein [Kineosporiaceae bacterium]MBK7621507.1 phosphodiester glycosidase family protein [Kineosporiaceae bacterium]MBK8077329.1 phosphodiester glycosidase family protein [Kineosporiaceae bacterium]